MQERASPAEAEIVAAFAAEQQRSQRRKARVRHTEFFVYNS
jgi:hypothetical protein